MAAPSNAGHGLSSTGQGGIDVSPQEHQMSVTEELIHDMEEEIKRQVELVVSRDNEMQQLRGEIDQLKRKIESIPITQLRERNNQLETEIDSKKQEIQRLTEKLRIVLSKDGTSSGMIEQLTAASRMLESQRIVHVQAIQKLTDTLEYKIKEIAELGTKLEKTEEELLQEQSKVATLEASCKQTQEENTRLVEIASIARMEMDQAKNDGALYLNRMNDLISYEEKCSVKERENHYLRLNVLPDKERTISQLTVTVTQLQDQLKYYAGDLMTKTDHLDILHAQDEHIRQSLRDTYREEYKTQVDSLEAGKAELERKLEHVENDLKTIQDGNDALVTANNAYRHLVSVNEQQKNTIEEQKQTVLKLRRDLVTYKDRVAKLEKRSVNKTLFMNETF